MDLCKHHMLTWFFIHMITIGIMWLILYYEPLISQVDQYIVDMKNPTNILMVAFSTYTLARFGLASIYFKTCHDHHDRPKTN